jgi:hypothetical protein
MISFARKITLGIPGLLIIVLCSAWAGSWLSKQSLQSVIIGVSEIDIATSSVEGDDFLAIWEEFCEELKVAGRQVAALTPGKLEVDSAEGYRYITRMLRLGLLAELEHVDPRHPVIWESETPTMKSAGNNPDELYHELLFDGSGTYRITGQRGSTPLFEFTVYEGRLGSSDSSKYVGHLMEDDLIVDEQGRFEIVLSPKPHPGNWIETTPLSNVVLIRQYRFDWQQDRPAEMTVTREDVLSATDPLTLALLGERLKNTSEFIQRSIKFWTGISKLTSLRAENMFSPPILGDESETENTTLPQGHTLQPGYYKIADDEALIVEFKPPAGLAYWGFSVYNWWFENLDYRFNTVHMNNFTAIPSVDGRVSIVVAKNDPGQPNWVSSDNHNQGTMLLRWTRPQAGVEFPEVSTRLVKLKDLL